jgi:hypothetical protein
MQGELHMFKNLLRDESGEANASALILTGLFIAAGVVFIALTYGIKVSAMLNALGSRF